MEKEDDKSNCYRERMNAHRAARLRQALLTVTIIQLQLTVLQERRPNLRNQRKELGDPRCMNPFLPT